MNPEPQQFSELASRAQAFLFMEGGALTIKRLASFLKTDNAHACAALDEVAQKIEGSGMALVRTDTEALLTVSKQVSPAIAEAYEGELGKEVGEAGLEVLAIVLYRGPSTRAQIDYIRGVNTSSTIRTLLSRGLLERAMNPNDNREFVYRPTTELIAHLGAAYASELPEYDKISSELRAFEEVQDIFKGASEHEESNEFKED